MSNPTVFQPFEAEALNAALDAIKEAVVSSTAASAVDPLLPPAFAPATGALDNVVAAFVPIPYTPEQIDSVVAGVRAAVNTKTAGAQLGALANQALELLVGLVPKLLAL